MALPPQTSTPLAALFPLPDQEALRKAFVGASLDTLRTPAAIVDVARVRDNCARMHKTAKEWGAMFRAHVKTHKTTEGARMQLRSAGGESGAIVVSTLAEAWGIIRSGLVEEGVVEDILYGLPLPIDKLSDIFALRAALQGASPRGTSAQFRLMVDHPDQVLSLERASVAAGAGASAASAANPWSVFIKIESGGKRAGLAPSSPLLVKLLETIVSSCPHVSVHGFYVHAGQSYASRSASEADSFLSTEVRSVNDAARLAKPILASSLDRHSQPFVLSVGSTPTAHAANLASSASTLNRLGAELEGALELHAGNYPFLDLQQLATGAVPVQSGMPAVAFSVLSTVIAEYPSRGTSSEAQAGEWAPDGLARSGDEGMCDAGGLAMSKDGGPWGGFGHVFWPAEKVGWELGRVSQEHGVLSVRAGAVKEWGLQWTNVDGKLGPVSQQGKPDRVRLGEKLRIVPQHACMTAAAYPWYYIIDSSSSSSSSASPTVPTVTDVWVPYKGW